MKILVFSDSHGNIINIKKVIEKINSNIEAVIHLGDNISDAYEIEMLYPKIKLYSVLGNCDFNEFGEDEQIIDINNKKIFISHGHRYNVYEGSKYLYERAKQLNADICLFGHTHRPYINKDSDIIIMNPGSISRPRGTDICSYGIIDISSDGIITPSVIGIYNNIFKVMNIDL